MSELLIAGVGNIFKGDDAFGVEVARRLARKTLPEGVKVIDFGIRGIDLTYALLDGYRAAVLVDAVRRGGEPGTVYIIEPDWPSTEESDPDDLLITPHDLDPAKVLRLVKALDGHCERLVLVGCEPETFGSEDEGAMGLSPTVAAAVDEAVRTIETLIGELLAPRRSHADRPFHESRRSTGGQDEC
jgi:hydrogenase maturation protease